MTWLGRRWGASIYEMEMEMEIDWMPGGEKEKGKGQDHRGFLYPRGAGSTGAG